MASNVMLRAASKERQAQAMEKTADLRNRQDSKDSAPGEIVSVDDDSQLAQAEILIEAAAEDESVKRTVLTQVGAMVKPNAVLATNTSSLSITKLAESVSNNANFLGMHFFHPVDKMPLVELIPHPKTDKQTVARATAFVHKLGKIPVTVKDSPGLSRKPYSQLLSGAGRHIWLNLRCR